MRIGIIVDGDSESQALKLLTRRIEIPGIQILDPIYANMQPKSAPGQIARSAKPQINILTAKEVNEIIILVDREDRQECPTRLAKDIKNAFAGLGHSNISVTIKNRKFENWLIADTGVFRRLRARYNLTANFENSVVPNRADLVRDAEQLLNRITVRGDYHKRRDASQITALQNIAEVGRNSRSFRKFLRSVKYPNYLIQSKVP